MPPKRTPRVESPVGGRWLQSGLVSLLGIVIRVIGPVLVVLFLLGATVGTGVAPVDRTAAALRAEVTGEAPMATSAGNVSLLDSDRDGVGNREERRFGTDPGDPDTDGDRLLDSWEVTGRTPGGAALPDSDPLHKDIYVQLLYAEDITPLSDRERAAFERAWARMPVENPDGTTGITLHYVRPRDPRLSARVTISSQDTETIKRLAERFYRPSFVGDYGCIVHQVAFVHVDSEEFVGISAGPGYQAFVDGTATRDYGTNYTVRVGTAVHELLHNVVGRFDAAGGVHTDRGWLSHGAFRESQFLSSVTAAELADGFDESRYYERRC